MRPTQLYIYLLRNISHAGPDPTAACNSYIIGHYVMQRRRTTIDIGRAGIKPYPRRPRLSRVTVQVNRKSRDLAIDPTVAPNINSLASVSPFPRAKNRDNSAMLAIPIFGSRVL